MILVLNMILTYAAMALLQIPLAAIGFASGSVWLTGLLNSIGELLATVLVAPFYTIAIALQYYDARVRKEAFDLQHMMQVLNASGQPAPAQASS